MIPQMVIDESERIPKWRFYSSNQVLGESEGEHDTPCFVKLPSKCPLRRTVSVPTSFKERKKHLQTHRRIKTSPASSRPSLLQTFSNAPADRKRKLQGLEGRFPERYDSQRWVYARRDDYDRYLIPRSSSTESTRVLEKEKQYEDDGPVLLGLAFVDEERA